QTEAGDDSGGGSLAVVFVASDEQADLLKSGVRIEQARDTFTRGQLTLAVLAFDLVHAAALSQAILQFAEFTNDFFQMYAVRMSCWLPCCLLFHMPIDLLARK